MHNDDDLNPDELRNDAKASAIILFLFISGIAAAFAVNMLFNGMSR